MLLSDVSSIITVLAFTERNGSPIKHPLSWNSMIELDQLARPSFPSYNEVVLSSWACSQWHPATPMVRVSPDVASMLRRYFSLVLSLNPKGELGKYSRISFQIANDGNDSPTCLAIICHPKIAD